MQPDFAMGCRGRDEEVDEHRQRDQQQARQRSTSVGQAADEVSVEAASDLAGPTRELEASKIDQAIQALIGGGSTDFFALLGPHSVRVGESDRLVIRVFQPRAATVTVIRRDTGAELPMERRSAAGLFDVVVPADEDPEAWRDYRLRLECRDGRVQEIDDAYRYGRVLTDYDLHLFAEGTHHRIYDKLGAHVLTVGDVTGVHFAVWAPEASRVSVIGDFNAWDGRVHAMRSLIPSGVWEIFVPGLRPGAKYKFEIRSSNGTVMQKADPYATRFELPPRSASIVHEIDDYRWDDDEWMRRRSFQVVELDAPMSIYEVHLGSWARVPDEGERFLTYKELAERLVPYVKELGFTHIELMPVMEHPFSGSWGYQVVGFYAPTSRHGTPQEFMELVDACHREGIGVILDWVPGHFPKDAHGLAGFDGTSLYEHEDTRRGEHHEWGTLVFNYGRHEVRNFLLANALFWMEQYHVDGLRVDAVASMLYLDYARREGEWLPNQYGGRENLEAIDFLRELNVLTHGKHPGSTTLAEESTAWPGVSRPAYLGGLGFTYKWNMGWMHDTLKYMQQDPVHRRWHHGNLTFSMLYAYHENFVLPFSHDEVVHGKRSMLDKMPGDVWQKCANLRALYGYMFGHPGKKMLFMGSEFGQWREWSHDRSLDWHLLDEPHHAGIQRFVADLNRVYRQEPALYELDFDPVGFSWIDCNDNENSVVSFVRRAKDPDDFLVMVVNFTPVPRQDYRIGVPAPGGYAELLNSDAEVYGGSNVGNGGWVNTEPIESHGQPQSLSLTLPPLGFVLLKPRR
jgi:1,4-alpha-glucan branching enzyme